MALQRSCLVAVVLAVSALTLSEPSATAAGPEVRGPAVRGSAVRGQILGPSGAGLPGSRVELLPVLPNFEAGRLTLAGLAGPPSVAGVETDARGRFEIRAAAPGLYAVRAGAPGFVPASYRPLPLVEAVELPPVRLQPDRGARLAVIAPDGHPAAGVWVFAETEDEAFWQRPDGEGWRPSFRKTRTDEAGQARLFRAEGETLRVTAFAPGSPARTLAGVGADGVVLALAGGERRQIEVTGEAGRPLSGVLVRSGPLAWPAGLTGPDGRLAVIAPLGEPLLLSLADTDGRLLWWEVSAAAGESEPVAVALPAPRTLEGRVVEADGGAPVAGALFWAPADPGIFRVSDRAGRFRLPVPPDGRLVVRAEAAGYLPARTRLGRAELTRGQVPDLELVPALRVAGRLVDPWGRAEAEAEVELVARHGDSGTRLRAASAGDGRFELGPMPAGDFALRVRKEGRAPLTLRHRPEKGQRALDLGPLVLQPEAVVLGEVLDPAGRPLPGAEIHALSGPAAALGAGSNRSARSDPDAVSDAEGRFRLGARVAGETLTLLVQASGFVPARLPGIEPPTARPLTVVLEPGWEVLGRAVDEEGRGVPGAEVRLVWRPSPGSAAEELAPRQSRTIEAVTDEDGGFTVAEVAPGLARIGVSAAGFAPAVPRQVEIPAGEGPAPLTFVLSRGASLEGRVETTDGRPLAGVRIGCDHADAVSDAEGLYRLASLPFRRIEVAAYRPDLGRQLKAVRVVAPSQRLDWTFAPGVEVAGRVLDPAGAPVAGAAVELEPVPGSAGGRYRGESGPGGTFTLTPVVPGRYHLGAGKAGFAEAGPATPVAIGSEPVDGLELVLVAAASISGRVLGLEVHELARVRVEARGAEEREHAGWVGSSGDYMIEDVPAGEWRVVADLDRGRRLASAGLHIPPGERTARLDLEFGPGLTLTGGLLRRGAPLAGAQVSLAGPDPHLRRTVGSSYLGEFRFSDLEPGRYRLEITHAAALVVHNQSFDLDHDAHLQLDLGYATVRGMVIAAGSYEPLRRAVITLLYLPSAPGEEEFLLSCGSDAAGLFELSRVPPGRYRLAARKDGFEAVEGELEVAAGRDVLDLELALRATAAPAAASP